MDHLHSANLPKELISCPLDKIPTEPLTSHIYSIEVMDPEADCSDKEISINIPVELKFSNKCEIIKCKSIKFTNCYAKIQNLKFQGTILAVNSFIICDNCDISSLENSQYSLVLGFLSNSIGELSNCQIHDSQKYAIYVNDFSILHIKESTIQNFAQNTISVSDNSGLQLSHTNVISGQQNLISAISNSFISIEETTLSNADGSAISINQSKLKAKNSHILNSSFLMARSSCEIEIENCDISNSPRTSIQIENSSASISKCSIDRANGNAIIISKHSSFDLSQCTFTNSKYPSCFVSHSCGKISQCLFENSAMLGFVARYNSKIDVFDTIIRHCKNSCCNISSTIANFKNCTFGDSTYPAFQSCDESEVVLDNCNFIGPFPNALNVFTCGKVKADFLSIVGPFESAFWAHHGGSLSINNSMIVNQDKPIEFDMAFDFFENIKQSSLLNKEKIEQVFNYNPQNEIPFYNNSIPESEQQNNYLSSICYKKVNSTFSPQFPNDTLEFKAPILLRTEKPKTDYDSSIFLVETQKPVIGSNLYVHNFGHYSFYGNNQVSNNNEDQSNKFYTCIWCGAKNADLHFNPCGHCLYCQDCWKKLESKPKECHLCKTEIIGVISEHEIHDNNICPICYENQVDSLIIPCGHVICKICSTKWFESNQTCPLCGAENNNLILLHAYS